jgi:hypothetical protein
MGWNTAALFAADHDPLTLIDAGTTSAGETVGGDEATSGLRHDVVYTAQTGKWHELWDPSMEHVLTTNRLTGQVALTVIFASVSSSYGFAYYDGHGLARQIVYADGEPVVDEGEPLPAEASIDFPSWGPDEDFVWAIIEAVTGLTFDLDRRYAVHRLTSP